MQEQVRFFSALSSEARIRILLLLREHPQCVKAIAERLTMSQPAVSQHLRVLKEAGLARAEKRGNWMHYELDAAGIQTGGRALEELFGGWVTPRAAAGGTANCPPAVLQECRGGSGTPGKRGVKGAKKRC